MRIQSWAAGPGPGRRWPPVRRLHGWDLETADEAERLLQAHPPTLRLYGSRGRNHHHHGHGLFPWGTWWCFPWRRWRWILSLRSPAAFLLRFELSPVGTSHSLQSTCFLHSTSKAARGEEEAAGWTGLVWAVSGCSLYVMKWVLFGKSWYEINT